VQRVELMWRRAALLCLLGAAACASSLPNCPKHGGPVWVELRGDHFVLSTDLPREEARRLLVAFEDLRAALLSAIAPQRTGVDTGRIPVIVLRDDEEWTALFREEIRGLFVQSFQYRPVIVVYPHWRQGIAEVVQHELTHYLTRFVVPRQSRWLAEGFAEYFQTVTVDRDKRTYLLGRSPRDALRYVQALGLMKLEDLFGDYGYGDPGFHATAWAVVHYLLNYEQSRFLRYQDMVAKGAQHAQAWGATFAGVSLADLRTAVEKHIYDGKYKMAIRPFVPPEVNATERVLADAEVHHLRATLYLISAGSFGALSEARARERVEEELAESAREDPTLPAALALRAWIEKDAASLIDGAKRTAADHPDDWMAWLAVAMSFAERDPLAARQALLRAAQLAASDPAVSLPTEVKDLRPRPGP